MNNRCKLSIIIPLFNSKTYFQTCLESIYSQGLPEDLFEVIVVDDGSDDGAEIIADEIAAAHSNMRVVHQANTGSPAIPRNKGLELASGTYIFFCDSDDMFLPGSFERIIQHAEEDKLDIGLFKLKSNGRDTYFGNLFECDKKHCTVFDSRITNYLGSYKLFRAAFLQAHSLSFPDTYYEDLPFVLEAYLLSQNTCIYTDEPYYFIRLRDDQTSMTQLGITRRGANSLEKRLRGLEYLAQTVSRYYSSSECPQLYERLFAHASMRLKSCLTSSHPDENLDRLRALLVDSFSPEIKERLDIRCNMSISALLNTSISIADLTDLAFSWPNGPACEFAEQDGSLTFLQYDSQGKVIDTGSIPLTSQWIESPHSRVHIFNCPVSLMHIGDGKAEYRGRCVIFSNTFQRIDSLQLACKSKTTESISFDVRMTDFTCDTVSETVRLHRFEFEWCAECELDALHLSGKNANNYGVFLTLRTDNGALSYRIGQTSDKQVKQHYARGFSFIGNELYYGSLTKGENATIGVKTLSENDSAAHVIAADVDKQARPALQVLLLSRHTDEDRLPVLGFRNRQSGSLVPISPFTRQASGSIEATAALDDALCRTLLSESQAEEVWELVMMASPAAKGFGVVKGIGAQRPPETMALLRQHAFVCDGHAFIFFENKKKNLSLLVQDEFAALDDAKEIKITAVSCSDHHIVMKGSLDAESVALYPQLQLAYRHDEDLFAMQGESFDDLDQHFQQEIRALFDLDDLLRRYDKREASSIDDCWNLEVIASLKDRQASHRIGCNRPKDSLIRYQKAACVRNDVAALPFEGRQKNLIIRVVDVAHLMENETALNISNVTYDNGRICIQGTASSPLLLCVDSLNIALCTDEGDLPLSVDLKVTGGAHPHAEWNAFMPLTASSLPDDAASSSAKRYCLSFAFVIDGVVYRLPVHPTMKRTVVSKANAALSSAGFPLKVSMQDDGIEVRRSDGASKRFGLSSLFRDRED